MFLKVQKLALTCAVFFLYSVAGAQYTSYKIGPRGDTLNATDHAGLKQGKWVLHVDPLRGEDGYEEEGIFVNDKREGVWRKYTLQGDLLAVENYRYGGKDGLCQYFAPLGGTLVREEHWHAYNPDAPFDTIAIYGTGSNEILGYKVVRAEQYSVKDGDWTYYDENTGMVQRTEKYDRGRLVTKQQQADLSSQPKKNTKPAEVIEYEKKNSHKKKYSVRDGQTSN